MYRALKITKTNGETIELEITKAVAVNSDKPMFSLEQMKDGNFRLIWSTSLCKKFSDISSLEIVREDDYVI